MKHFTSALIPDMKDKTVIITGANTGIGYEAALSLAQKDARVIIGARNTSKGNEAMGKILKEHGSAKVRVMELDLASLASVERFSNEFLQENDRLDLLINNAGVMIPPYIKTSDGFELQMGTNHLGHFALTSHLMPLLSKTAQARVINVSSMAHKRGNINIDDLNWEKRRYSAFQAYADSKIANLFFTYELARRIEKENLSMLSVAAHPGWSATDLMRHNNIFEFAAGFLAQSQKMGALPTLYAAVGEDIKNGDYTGPSGFMEIRGYPKKVKSIKATYNEEFAKKFWEKSQECTGIEYSFSE